MSSDAATREEIARLFGRAAFGATPADLDAWTGKPYADAVNHLVDFPASGSRLPATDDARREAQQEGGRQGTDLTGSRSWWLERMRTTQYPLEERMTLLWHGHFATSLRDPYPDVALLMVQNETMRRNALGNFRDLVVAMTLDPAMLEWLDGSRNTIPVPNENYGRELMELFTLGKYPQVYSESDVRDAARALTGWTLNPFTREVKFQPTLHDVGLKTVLGTRIADQGAAEYTALIDVVLAQPVAPLFVAYKLVANLAYGVTATNLLTQADPLVARVAGVLRSSGWNIREAVRTLLLSDEFRTGDGAARRQLVRSPTEIVVAAGKVLNVSLEDASVLSAMHAMGQPLFAPPNVGGWPVGTAWLSPSTELGRYALAAALQLKAPNTLPASGDLDGWAHFMGLGALSPPTVSALQRFLADQHAVAEKDRQAGVLILLLTSPDWMVI